MLVLLCHPLSEQHSGFEVSLLVSQTINETRQKWRRAFLMTRRKEGLLEERRKMSIPLIYYPRGLPSPLSLRDYYSKQLQLFFKNS